MENINDILPVLKIILNGLAEHFGKKVEFVLHDYSKGFSSSIVAIENGELTGRKVGDSGTRLGLEIQTETKKTENGRYRYTTQTKDGKRFSSSTIYLKNDEGKVIGSLCINMDVSELIPVRNFINQFFCDKASDSVVYNNVDDLLSDMIAESVDTIGVPISSMTREQKIEGIQYLQKRGAFQIKNAVNTVATYYDISRYTVYNYINEKEKL